jgi:hypothetical protein
MGPLRIWVTGRYRVGEQLEIDLIPACEADTLAA